MCWPVWRPCMRIRRRDRGSWSSSTTSRPMAPRTPWRAAGPTSHSSGCPRTEALPREQRRHPGDDGNAGAAAQQRHAGDGGRRSRRCVRPSSASRARVRRGRRLVDGDGRQELSFGPMISPLGRDAPEAADTMAGPRAGGVAAAHRRGHGATPVRRLGQRRLPAGASGGRRAGRAARRALFHVLRGRGLLRRAACRAAIASCTCPRWSSRTCAAVRAPRPRWPRRAATATATSPSTASTTRGGRRCSAGI